MPSSAPSWDALREHAARHGLNRLWRVPRAAVDPHFADFPAHLATPATLHPGYRTAVVLASAGPDFWRTVQRTHGIVPDPAENPLDRASEQAGEALCALLRAVDPDAVAAYPFRHPRQLLGFQRLLAAAPWMASAPFGVAVAPEIGPWWALRAVLLTRLEADAAPPTGESPCAACPAPCVAACPAGAVHTAGFAWEACADYRLAEAPCRETCLARLACPVGTAYRYDADALRHHYRASLRELQQWWGA